MGKVNDVGMQVLSDSDMVTLGLGEGQLQSAEQARRSRDGAGDEAELAQDAFPFLGEWLKRPSKMSANAALR